VTKPRNHSGILEDITPCSRAHPVPTPCSRAGHPRGPALPWPRPRRGSPSRTLFRAGQGRRRHSGPGRTPVATLPPASSSVHLEKIAFTMSFPAPWRPPRLSDTTGEKSTPIRPHDSALSRFFCSILCLRNVAALPRRGRPVAGLGWKMVRSTSRSRPQSHALSRTSFNEGNKYQSSSVRAGT